jgi:hypothetical protein
MAQEVEREIVKLRQANGALLDAPIYEDGPRRSNYLAIIDIDPTMPGGLARRFADKGRGECLYLSEKVDLFDAVEFASDYTTTTGNKHRARWYGVVVAKTEDCLLLEHCSTGANAVLRAKRARTSPQDRVRALAAEREVLISRAAAIQGEIAQIREDDLDVEEFDLSVQAVPSPTVAEPEPDPIAFNDRYDG